MNRREKENFNRIERDSRSRRKENEEKGEKVSIEKEIEMAVLAGEFSKVLTLVKEGGVPNWADSEGWTPLMYCAAKRGPMFEKIRFSKSLVEMGADPNAKNESGAGALAAACSREGTAELVSCLLSLGAEATAVDMFGFTPLHRAAISGDLEVIALLLAAGADPNARSGFGRNEKTAEEVARDYGKKEAEGVLRSMREKEELSACAEKGSSYERKTL